jgi:TolB-like protein/DNA-binding winged helix-turn-helix (wHTH) protein
MNTVTKPQALEFEGFRLEPGRRLLVGPDGRPIELQPKAFDTLAVLAERAGELLDRRTLMAAVWPNVVVEENNLNQAVAAVRRALSSAADGARFIATSPGRGYQFVVPVRVIDKPDPGHASSSRPGAARARWAYVGTVIVMLLAAALVWRLERDAATAGASIAATGRSVPRASIAVLPFAAVAPAGEDQTYLAEGLSDQLRNALAQVDGLLVSARTSSMMFAGGSAETRAISDALGVRYVLEGSVRWSADRLRVNIQLVDAAADGYHVWAKTYDRALADIIDAQDDITRDAADALRVALGLETPSLSNLDGAGTHDAEAYRLFLVARALRQEGSAADGLRAEALLRDAVSRDPTFWWAWAELTRVLESVSLHFPERSESALAQRAVIIDRLAAEAPTSWAASAARALQRMEQRDWAGAFAAVEEGKGAMPAGLEQAIEGFSMYLDWRIGRVSAALDHQQRVVRMDPLSLAESSMLQYLLFAAGLVDDAEAEYARSLDLLGARNEAEVMAFTRAVVAEYDRSIIEERLARLVESSPRRPLAAIDIVPLLDDRQEALVLLRREFEEPDPERGTPLLLVAWMAEYFGDTELALAALEGWIEAVGDDEWGLWDGFLAETRKEPGFRKLVERLGYADHWRTSGDWADFCRPVNADGFECF